jgi:hypothetical protein
VDWQPPIHFNGFSNFHCFLQAHASTQCPDVYSQQTAATAAIDTVTTTAAAAECPVGHHLASHLLSI